MTCVEIFTFTEYPPELKVSCVLALPVAANQPQSKKSNYPNWPVIDGTHWFANLFAFFSIQSTVYPKDNTLAVKDGRLVS